MAKSTLKRGMRVTRNDSILVTYGSHQEGHTHKVVRNPILTVTKVSRWYVDLATDDGGRTVSSKSGWTIVTDQDLANAEIPGFDFDPATGEYTEAE